MTGLTVMQAVAMSLGCAQHLHASPPLLKLLLLFRGQHPEHLVVGTRSQLGQVGRGAGQPLSCRLGTRSVIFGGHGYCG